MKNWRGYNETFRYQMLDRMKQDCEYYLNHGNRNPEILCGGSEQKHIENMQAIWNTFSATDKPEWLSYEDIEEYAKQMGVLSGKTLEIYRGQYRGVYVSEYGIENGELDFKALADIAGPFILNNSIRDNIESDWEVYCGDSNDYIMHEYIISEEGAEFLKKYTYELVFYNPDADVYIWAVTHTNTVWTYVLTGVKLVERG